MVRVLQATSFVVAAITGIALALLVVGLVVSARPELAAGFGLELTSRDGLAIAFTSGAVAIVGGVLGRVLNLVRDNLANGNGRATR